MKLIATITLTVIFSSLTFAQETTKPRTEVGKVTGVEVGDTPPGEINGKDEKVLCVTPPEPKDSRPIVRCLANAGKRFAEEKVAEPLSPSSPVGSALPRTTAKVEPELPSKFNWSDAIKQSLFFLGTQHGFALATQAKTRSSLRGPFFKDYIRSVTSLRGWSDGGRFFTNYVAHPMQGSFLGFIQVQNDPKGKSIPLSKSPSYWKSRAKALAWSAAWSTQFEIGPISQASIGNVGKYGKQSYVDIVMTPTAGLLFLIAEDALDKYVIRRIERMSPNFFLRVVSRMIFNPTRTVANIVRLKTPWHRDKGLR